MSEGIGEPNEDRQPADGLIAMIGLAAGLSSAFLGIGGGLVLVPALSLLLGCSIKRAVGTSLEVALFISLAGVVADWEIGGMHIQWSWALALTLGSLLGSALGARLLTRIADNPLRLALAGVLLAASIRLSIPSLGLRRAVGMVIAAPAVDEHLLILMVGIIAGATSVLVGVGGGIATIPALALIWGDLPLNAIRGTSLAAVVIAAAIGARQHARLGHVDQALARALAPAGMAGAVLGVVAATYFPTRLWEMGFAALLAFVAVRLLSDVLPKRKLGGRPSQLGRGGRRAGTSAP
jgi:uncharacterized membrane protein YfcA